MKHKEILHKHVIIRTETKYAPGKSQHNENYLNDTIEGLISLIGMKTVLPARCVWVGQEGNEGYTGQAGLETSHIAYHIWNNPTRDIMNNDNAHALIQLDLYTCGCLGNSEIIKVVEWLKEWVIVDLEVKILDRANTISEIKDIVISQYDVFTNNIEMALSDKSDVVYNVFDRVDK